LAGEKKAGLTMISSINPAVGQQYNNQEKRIA